MATPRFSSRRFFHQYFPPSFLEMLEVRIIALEGPLRREM